MLVTTIGVNAAGVAGVENPPPYFDKGFMFFPLADFLNVASRCHFQLQCAQCTVFTVRCYASAVLAFIRPVSVSPYDRLSVRPSQVGTAKLANRRITQTTPHDIPGTLVV